MPNTLHPLKASLKSSVPLLRLRDRIIFRQMFFHFQYNPTLSTRDMMYVGNCKPERPEMNFLCRLSPCRRVSLHYFALVFVFVKFLQASKVILERRIWSWMNCESFSHGNKLSRGRRWARRVGMNDPHQRATRYTGNLRVVRTRIFFLQRICKTKGSQWVRTNESNKKKF